MTASVHEPEVRAGDRVLDGAQDEDLAGRGRRGDPGADVDCYAAELVAELLTLACVQARPHLDSEGPHRTTMLQARRTARAGPSPPKGRPAVRHPCASPACSVVSGFPEVNEPRGANDTGRNGQHGG
jgi:hypothetical protein